MSRNINNDATGMVCSRQYAEWMMNMNEKLDFPVESYYLLVRLFSRPQYQAFFDEENRKGNNFTYHLLESAGKLTLKPTIDLVYLDYREIIDECTVEPFEDMILGYRILQTRGYLPGSYESVFYKSDVSYDNLIEKLCNRPKSCAKLKEDDGTWVDTYNRFEFQRAESKGFIDNEWPFSAGPACPDRLICYCSFYNILETLIKDIKKLGLIPEDSDSYELRVLSVASVILTYAYQGRIRPKVVFDKMPILEQANTQFEQYSKSKTDKELEDICRQINDGLEVHVKVEIGTRLGSSNDCDFDDLTTAPVGLTDEDYEEFSNMT